MRGRPALRHPARADAKEDEAALSGAASRALLAARKLLIRERVAEPRGELRGGIEAGQLPVGAEKRGNGLGMKPPGVDPEPAAERVLGREPVLRFRKRGADQRGAPVPVQVDDLLDSVAAHS